MTTRTQRRLLAKQNARTPTHLVPVPRHEWPEPPPGLIEVWRSRSFLVQVFDEGAGLQRLSVCRTSRNGDEWADQITWDELMRCKRECGRGDRDALEVYPPDRDVVNVANMRHLWLPVEPIPFAWRARPAVKAPTHGM